MSRFCLVLRVLTWPILQYSYIFDDKEATEELQQVEDKSEVSDKASEKSEESDQMVRYLY